MRMSESWNSRRGLSVREACIYAGIGRTSLYRLIREGIIKVVKVGHRTIIPLSELDSLLRVR